MCIWWNMRRTVVGMMVTTCIDPTGLHSPMWHSNYTWKVFGTILYIQYKAQCILQTAQCCDCLGGIVLAMRISTCSCQKSMTTCCSTPCLQQTHQRDRLLYVCRKNTSTRDQRIRNTDVLNFKQACMCNTKILVVHNRPCNATRTAVEQAPSITI